MRLYCVVLFFITFAASLDHKKRKNENKILGNRFPLVHCRNRDPVLMRRQGHYHLHVQYHERGYRRRHRSGYKPVCAGLVDPKGIERNRLGVFRRTAAGGRFNGQLELINEADVLSRLNPGDTVSLQLNIYSPVNAVLAVEKWGKAALDRNKLKIEPVSKENLHIGETFRLTVKYDGQEIPMSEITWKFWPNEKQTVFSVDENGLVTATGIGRAVIQPVYQGCTAAREGGLCDITVVEAE